MSGAPFHPTFFALSLAIVLGCAASLWWLLRRETATALLALAVVTSLSLALRFVYTTDFPRGLNEDEPKVLYAAGKAVEKGTVLAESNISVPILPHALFQGQLIAVFGPGRWAIRTYNLVGGVLATPAAFAAARAIGLRVAASLSVGAFVSVLPWAMFYSRVMTGGELTFQQLLLLAVLARLVFASDRPVAGGRQPAPRDARQPWREWLLGSFALAWLLYGYWCTRAMLGMSFVAVVLARGRRRWWCLAIPAVALATYWPYVEANRNSMFIAQGVNLAYYGGFGGLRRLLVRTGESLQALALPVGENGWLTVAGAAVHPEVMLGLALIGSLSGVRRALFLWAGFLGGLAPAVLAWGPPSTHRMLMAYPFIALAAGCALDAVPRRGIRRAAAALAVGVIGWQSLTFYFSDAFWRSESRWTFDWTRTDLVASLPLPPSPPVIAMRQVSFYRDPRRLIGANDQDLSVDNWFPGNEGAVYAFTGETVALRPFYENVFGPTRVESFGWAFKVMLEPRDWSWFKTHGWAYEARCGSEVARGQVPVLFQPNLTFASFVCAQPTVHVWRGRWLAGPTPMRLRASGPASVATPQAYVADPSEGDTLVEFTAEPGAQITVTVTTPPFNPWVFAAAMEVTPIGERVPAWGAVSPVFGAEAQP